MPKSNYCANAKCSDRMKCKKYIFMLRKRLHPTKCTNYRPEKIKDKYTCKGFESIKT